MSQPPFQRLSTLSRFPALSWEAGILYQDTESNWQIGLFAFTSLRGVGHLCSILGADQPGSRLTASADEGRCSTLICGSSESGSLMRPWEGLAPQTCSLTTLDLGSQDKVKQREELTTSLEEKHSGRMEVRLAGTLLAACRSVS